MNKLIFGLAFSWVLAGLVPAVRAQQAPPRVTHYYIDDGTAFSAEDFGRVAEDPARADAAFWQVQLYREGSLERDSAWGAISGPDWKSVLDQYYRELTFEQDYRKLFRQAPPQYKERNYTNHVAPVAIRVKKKARQYKALVAQLPTVSTKLNKHIDFFVSANKTVEDNSDVLMSNELRNQLKNYATELMRITKNFRNAELELLYDPNPLLMENLIRGDYRGKGGIDEALAPLEKLQPALQQLLTKEYDPERPIPVQQPDSSNN
ncbi:MAG: hypothetical protein AVDCRST_MAG56-2561 [uncultured Cytophagales bacterium]|uniref:Uncharacterized protein n=1 Tax=uncultured Cytophagales bacterium TaxID=158755 RepID=A0A6J4ISN0_9SPHI|nr:MAG: hypothetical protein AVDCRST_MAG56-2561 [uncultured Cytophagales bacterium]